MFNNKLETEITEVGKKVRKAARTTNNFLKATPITATYLTASYVEDFLGISSPIVDRTLVLDVDADRPSVYSKNIKKAVSIALMQ